MVTQLCAGTDFVVREPDNKAPLSNDAFVHRLSDVDVDQLLRAWSWISHKGMKVSGPPWVTRGNVEGQELWIRGNAKGIADRRSSQVSLTTSLEIQTYEPQQWIAQHQEALGSRKLILTEDFSGVFTAQTGIDLIEEIGLSGGMTIGDFKSRMLEFARAAKTLSAAPHQSAVLL